MAFSDTPERPEPRVSPQMLVGAVSPLWSYFGAAAAGGMAFWWMTRWTQPVNLEALFDAATRAMKPTPAPVAALETIAEPVAEAPEPEPVMEAPAVLEAAPEPVVTPEPEPSVEAAPEPVVEVAPEPVAEAAPEVVPEPIAEAAPEPAVEAVPEPVVEPAPEPVLEAAAAPAPKPRPKKSAPEA